MIHWKKKKSTEEQIRTYLQDGVSVMDNLEWALEGISEKLARQAGVHSYSAYWRL